MSQATSDPTALVPATELVRGPKRQVYRLCRTDPTLRAVKLGRVWYVRPVDVVAWIASQGRDSAANDAEADLLRAGVRFGR